MNDSENSKPKQKVGVIGVVFMIYAMACAGAFGIEDMIPFAGPGLTVVMLIVIPFFWAVPNALISAELGSALPYEGGSYVWVKRAFGEFWGFQSCFGRLVSYYVGVPIYVVLAGDYMGSLLNWNDTYTYTFKLILIAIFAFINYKGVKDVAAVGTVLGILIVAAFACVIIIGFSHAQYNPVEPFAREDQSVIASVGGALAIGMWMYTGYESMANVAGELENPQVIPKALMIVVPLIILTYVPTTIAGLCSVGQWKSWGTDGVSYGDVAALAGSGWAVFFVVVAFLGQISTYNSWMATSSRAFLVLAEDNLAPKILTKTNKNSVPIVGWALMVALSVLFASFSFDVIAILTVTAILFPTSLMMFAALKLRISEPDLPRPFKVKLNNFWFGALCMLVPLTAFVALYLNGLDYFVAGCAMFIIGPILYMIARKSLGGMTKKDPEHNPENPKTKMPYGDMKRIAFFYFMLGVLVAIGYFFLNWYEDPAYYIETYGNEHIFNLFMGGVVGTAAVSFILAIVFYGIHKKKDDATNRIDTKQEGLK
ncbi:APC family permease [Eubacteriales bacterium DFI.9.88]|nr:APC family permease [Clostridia bacterium]MDE8735128.1 APC family permease [Eubacteriales bacterium DFI.9.88]